MDKASMRAKEGAGHAFHVGGFLGSLALAVLLATAGAMHMAQAQTLGASTHACAITASGALECWGVNQSGELGDGTFEDRSRPVDVVGLSSGVRSVGVGGGGLTCALDAAGGVRCWGYGNLGNGSSFGSPIPVGVSGLSTGVTAIAVGSGYACALTNGGAVKCWGSNYAGQLGDGSATDRLAPVSVVGLQTGVKAISASSEHTCALLSNGAIKCWGSNRGGLLGDGNTQDSLIPVEVAGLGGIAQTVSATWNRTCAVIEGGALKCWGMGQLSPAAVSGLGADVVAVVGGALHYCALLIDGQVRCWGSNGNGELGDGTLASRDDPAPVVGLARHVVEISASGSNTCAKAATGSIQCWGYNLFGQIGDGSSTRNPVPVDVMAAGSNFVRLAASSSRSCGITQAGIAMCWGNNTWGALGEGTLELRSLPTPVLGLELVVDISTGANFSCGVSGANRTVMCWGEPSGAWGNPTALPVPGIGSGVKQIATGSQHACALTDAGALKCWGFNYAGQLGDGTTVDRSAAVDVVGMNSGVVSVSAKGGSTCAVMDGGTVKCWGDNRDGQLGDGTSVSRSVPTDVVGLSGIAEVQMGDAHACALNQVGSLKCWGSNIRGQLGDGTMTSRTTPVDVQFPGMFKAVAIGLWHTCAVTSIGSIKCWGEGSFGQLGDGTYDIWRVKPLADVIGFSSEAISIVAGGNHTCGLVESGMTRCWGINTYGELGDGQSAPLTPRVVDGFPRVDDLFFDGFDPR